MAIVCPLICFIVVKYIRYASPVCMIPTTKTKNKALVLNDDNGIPRCKIILGSKTRADTMSWIRVVSNPDKALMNLFIRTTLAYKAAADRPYKIPIILFFDTV